MPLFTGGRLINQVRAEDFLWQSANHRAARSRDELVFNVSSVFFGILSQERVIGALDFSRATLEQHLARVDALVAARKAAPVDRMRTEVRLADVTQRLVKETTTGVVGHSSAKVPSRMRALQRMSAPSLVRARWNSRTRTTRWRRVTDKSPGD
jgi:hypothetical protein